MKQNNKSQKFIFKNDELIAEDKALISVDERGFLFGDGIFETCHVNQGRIINFDKHKIRILIGLESLKFKAEISDLEERSQKLIKENGLLNGLLRISISRGIGSLGYLPSNRAKALVIIQTLEIRKLPEKICLGISKISPPKFPFKTMNSLLYILNKMEADEEKIFDKIMLDENKNICETSSANIFWIKNGEIFTPSEKCNIILGCIRESLLELKELRINKIEAKISAIIEADEVFLTNSSFLILPVESLQIKVGDKVEIKEFSKTLTNKIQNLLFEKLQIKNS